MEDLRAALQRCLAMDAPLEERLAAYARASATYAPEFVGPIDALVARLLASGAGSGSPAPGTEMPPFCLPDETGRLLSLDDLLAQGPLVLVFDRGHWCPYCRISLATLAEAQRRIAALGAGIAAIVPERAAYTQLLKSATGARFPVLTDFGNGYSLSIGLAFWMGHELQRLYSDAGRRVEEYQGDPSWMTPIPATFVIAQDGSVVERFIEPDYRRRSAIDAVVAAVARAAAIR